MTTRAADPAFEARLRAWEEDALSPLAARSYPAVRDRPEDDCSLRTPFQRDRDRIVHCKSFRRLKHKTQVFVAPEGDHYRTRLTHTLEVTAISRTDRKSTRLNSSHANISYAAFCLKKKKNISNDVICLNKTKD